MNNLFVWLFILILGASYGASTEQPAVRKSGSLTDLAPPLKLDSSCHVVGCYRNLLNVSNNCGKGEYLHSFKKCEKKFFREDTCCKKADDV